MTLTTDVHRLRLPAASVYVVDGLSIDPSTNRLVASIQNRRTNARVIVLVQDLSDPNSFSLLRLGVKGLLTYTAALRHLAPAVRSVSVGGLWVTRQLLSAFVDSVLKGASRGHSWRDPTDLSERERQVLHELLENRSNKEIGARLHIAERTVKFHVTHLLHKFGVRRRADLILLQVQGRRPKSTWENSGGVRC